MPLYELRDSAVNNVDIGESAKSICCGNDLVLGEVFQSLAKKSNPVLVIDGWYGVEWEQLKSLLAAEAKSKQEHIEFFDAASLFKGKKELNAYYKKYLTEDPSFGWVNSEGVLNDILDDNAVKALSKEITTHKKNGSGILCVIGVGAYNEQYGDEIDQLLYADFTMQPLLWKMWDGKLVPFGNTVAEPKYFWKQYYYNDFYLLYRQKKLVFQKMDKYLEAVDIEKLKVMNTDVYNVMIDELVKYPIKQVKILQPGPWGAYRYRDLWEVEGLECSAWNELAGIELSVLIDVGATLMINIPAQNFMQRPLEVVGEYIHKTYPDLLPLQVWMDDGYFPEPVSFERSSMTVHNHPGTDYNRKYFNEPLGRYETYYICEAYKNATTWMGFKKNADLESWEKRIRESNNQVEISDWQEYVKRWDTNVGDLFLIPPGTDHGHGGNQMILEMDTGPSVAGTEYSFFGFDFARNTWDDEKKSMTGPRVKMHLDHYVRNNKWIREEYVEKYHRARPIVTAGNGKTRKDQYTTFTEMPFHIERLCFEKEMENDTEGKFMHMVTLTEGSTVTIRSKKNPKYCTTIERYQAAIVPASFGEHVYINEDGNHAMVVLIRMKKG